MREDNDERKGRGNRDDNAKKEEEEKVKKILEIKWGDNSN